MITVKFVTNARGFLKDLFLTNDYGFKIVYEEKKVYDSNSRLKRCISSLVKNPIFDYIGFFQSIHTQIDEDCALSYNRFIVSNKPYILLIENPLALVHYSINRPKTFLSKKRIKKYLMDTNLKAIIGVSNACTSTLREFYDIPNRIRVMTIYPYVKVRNNISMKSIEERANKKQLNLLYISANFELKGGQDILHTFERLNDKNIKLTIVTRLDSVSESDRVIIDRYVNNITLFDFVLSKDELAKLYASTNILLNPTRQDSSSLVTLEAMKYGNTVLSSDMYAIKEMVEDGKEGFLTKAKYDIWLDNNLPNKKIWNHRKNTIYSSYVDEKMVDFLYEKITLLKNNRDMLADLQKNAYVKANTGKFAEENILGEWKKLFEETGGYNE